MELAERNRIYAEKGTSHDRYDEETLQMELIAAAHSDEEPDDGALPGSEDEYQE